MSQLNWARDPGRNPVAGEAGGFFVTSDGPRYSGYLKPTRICPPDLPRAAAEKIAFDISHEVGVQVPPVQIYHRPDANPDHEEVRTCISLVCDPWFIPWNQLDDWRQMDKGVDDRVKAEFPKCSSFYALDVYLGQADRKMPRNTLLSFDPRNDNFTFVFIDYSYSMNFRNSWENEGWKKVGAVDLPKGMAELLDRDIVRQTAVKVRDLNEGTLNGIVDRIPGHFLSDAQKTTVKQGLIGRRRIAYTYLMDH